jgi:hypothetical protein
MAETFVGKVEFKNSQGDVVLTIDPDADFVQIVLVAGKQIFIGDKFCNVNMPNDCIAKRYFANTVGGQIQIGDDFGNVNMPNDCIAKRYFANTAGGQIQIGDDSGNVHMPNDCIAKRYFANTVGGQIQIGDDFGNVHMPNDCVAKRYFANTAGGQIQIGDDFGNVHMPNDCIAKRYFAQDIFISGADCAEHFDVADADTLEPGTVMVINPDGRLEQSVQEYDKKVAGVISGAGKHKTGIVLDRQESEVNRRAIALMGKVYCKVDANNAPIEVGDLLTTSSTRGHAMKAADPVRALGTLIGKALRRLESGQGIIPILVALQ